LGHEDNAGNKTTNQLVKLGSEPACSISVGVVKEVVDDWTNKATGNIEIP
jgi:hypothetical protein